ncbi:MAG: hypothetical protein ACYC5K_04635 [Saccharofermentanales bacterium]
MNYFFRKIAVAGFVLGIILTLAAWFPIRMLFGTSGLTKTNMPHVQVVIKSVELQVSRGMHSVVLDANPDNGAIYELTTASINALLVKEHELKVLEGEIADLWVDKNDRILQIKSNGHEYINFDKALSGQKTEDRLFFVFGLILGFAGMIIITISSILLHKCHKSLINRIEILIP